MHPPLLRLNDNLVTPAVFVWVDSNHSDEKPCKMTVRWFFQQPLLAIMNVIFQSHIKRVKKRKKEKKEAVYHNFGFVCLRDFKDADKLQENVKLSAVT